MSKPTIRHGYAVLTAALVLALAACGGETGTTTTTTAPEATTTTTAAATTTMAPTTTAPTTTTSTEATTTTSSPVDADTTWAVVLVAPDDVLNVRDEPLGDIVFTLDPTETGITATGATETLDDGDLWREIEVGGQPGWVNALFIAEELTGDAFGQEVADPLVDGLTSWAVQGDGPPWSSLVGPKGFNVVHFDQMKSWPPGQNPFQDPTVYDWGGEATGPGQPVATETFAVQVGSDFAGVVEDQDLQTSVNQPLGGAEAAPAFIPAQFENFDYVAFHDPGDDPSVDGLDWTTWYVYFDWTGSGWALVGMSVDGWAP